MNEDSVRLYKYVLALLAGVILLSGVVAYLALRPRLLVAVPGLQQKEVIVAGRPKPAQVAAFALLCAGNMENFTFATIEAQDRFLLERVSPRFVTELSRVLEERKGLIRESKMSSQLIAHPESLAVKEKSDGLWEVSFHGSKQVFVADRLSWREQFTYKVALEAGFPSRTNPQGLFLAGLAISRIADQKGKKQ